LSNIKIESLLSAVGEKKSELKNIFSFILNVIYLLNK